MALRKKNKKDYAKFSHTGSDVLGNKRFPKETTQGFKEFEAEVNALNNKPKASTSKPGKSSLIFSKADQTTDPRTRETVFTESMQNDEDYRIPVNVSRSKENFGLFTVKKEDGAEVPVNPSHESIIPRSVVKDVPRGRTQQKAIGAYNKLRKK